jgi:large subunit ribosomal protein L19
MSFSEILNKIQQQKLKLDRPDINVGDTVRADVLIIEGNKQRVQTYQGTIISQHRNGINSTVTIRRVLKRTGVERIFFLHSPLIKAISVQRRTKVRRAKLYYLRRLQGKAARLRERFIKKKLNI